MGASNGNRRITTLSPLAISITPERPSSDDWSSARVGTGTAGKRSWGDVRPRAGPRGDDIRDARSATTES